MTSVEALSGLKPKMKPGLIHKLDREYFKRVEAVEFAVKYDDGKNPWGFFESRYSNCRRFADIENTS